MILEVMNSDFGSIWILMMSISKVCGFDFQRMARTRGGMTESQNRGMGRGRARGRGRVLGVQSEDVRRIERADVSVRN